MPRSDSCPKCGAALPPGAPAGICPKCLMLAGLESQGDADDPPADPLMAATTPLSGGFTPPRPADLAAYFPHLEILTLLGQGGMGAVYQVRQTKLDRLVALKIIRPESANDPAFAERFNREARTLARLSHPCIVAVHDFGEVTLAESDAAEAAPGKLYYFLMEYVDGANLRQLLQTGELQPEQALAIIPQICDALQFAHDEGIVHRDIKPENVLLDCRGRVKIADFGLAKLVSGNEQDFTLTGTQQVMGTPRYMAPEQMEGSRGVDHRADIYSLGVVFYEMLTGEVPVGIFEPPSKKVAVDVRIDEVVLRSLAREPERRYQQANDVKTDVEAVSYPDARGVDSASASRTSTSVVDGTAATSPRSGGTLRQAWDAWWAARDKWVTNSVQGLLVLGFFFCLIMFFAFETSTAPAPAGAPGTRHVTVDFGRPSPWFHLETNPENRTAFRFQINYFTTSSLVMLLGFVAWGVHWQIEQAKVHATGKKLGWAGSPNSIVIAWGVLVLLAVAWGFHPLYLDVGDRRQADRAETPLATIDDPGGVTIAEESRSAGDTEPEETSPAAEFLAAVSGGDLDRVRQILAAGATAGVDVNARGSDGQTVLMKAAAAGHPRMVALLILRGADEIARDQEAKTPLMYAVVNGHAGVVQMLSDMKRASYEKEIQFRLQRIDPQTTVSDLSNSHFDPGRNVQDAQGETALMKAAARGDTAIYEALRHFSDDMLRDKLGRTALMHAIENRKEPFLKPYFEQAAETLRALSPENGYTGVICPEALSITDSSGRTPLAIAEELKMAGTAEEIRLYCHSVIDRETRLMTRKDAKNLWIQYHHRGLAHQALGNVEQAEFDASEAQRFKDLSDDPDAFRRAALHAAAQLGNVSRVQELLAGGARVNDKDASGRTPLMIAAANNHASLCQTLMVLGASGAERDGRSRTALMHAAANGHVSVVEALIQIRRIGVEVGSTEARVSQIKRLSIDPAILAKIDLEQRQFDFALAEAARDANGDTALELAQKQGHDEIADLLRRLIEDSR